jgi:hypothetical protein
LKPFFLIVPFYYLTVHSHEVSFLFGSAGSCRQRLRLVAGGGVRLLAGHRSAVMATGRCGDGQLASASAGGPDADVRVWSEFLFFI